MRDRIMKKLVRYAVPLTFIAVGVTLIWLFAKMIMTAVRFFG